MTASLEKSQPQVITSPDGKLQILHHKMTISYFGHAIVDGTIKNIGSDFNIRAEMRVEYYDANGTLIDTEVDTVRLLEPGKTGAFEVVHTGPRRGDVKYYKITDVHQVQHQT